VGRVLRRLSYDEVQRRPECSPFDVAIETASVLSWWSSSFSPWAASLNQTIEKNVCIIHKMAEDPTKPYPYRHAVVMDPFQEDIYDPNERMQVAFEYGRAPVVRPPPEPEMVVEDFDPGLAVPIALRAFQIPPMGFLNLEEVPQAAAPPRPAPPPIVVPVGQLPERPFIAGSSRLPMFNVPTDPRRMPRLPNQPSDDEDNGAGPSTVSRRRR